MEVAVADQLFTHLHNEDIMADFYLDYRGSDYNGGGYDSTITGATVNLASGQYAALTASGLECTAGSTTVTSVHGGFTTDMIGNAVNIIKGYDYTWGIYWVTGVPNSTTLELDSSPAPSDNAVSGVLKVGGSWRTEANFKRDGSGWGWFFYNAVGAGDKIYIKGNGEENPVSGQYYGSPYSKPCQGSSDEPILMQGYNGRPAWEVQDGNLFFHEASYIVFDHIKWFGSAGTWETNYGAVNGGSTCIIHDCIFDQGGTRAGGFRGHVTNCYVYNSKKDETASYNSSTIGINALSHGVACYNNVVENYVGNGIYVSEINNCDNNVINNVDGYGIFYNQGGSYHGSIKYNTVNRCKLQGIRTSYTRRTSIVGNLVTNCSGAAIANTRSANENYAANPFFLDFNAFYGNTMNASGYGGGRNDIVLTADPYTNESSGDFTLNNAEGGGKSCRGAFVNTTAGYGKSQSYQDIGALQAYDK